METCCSRFTAAEGGVRLAAVASEKNIIITEHCSFVSTRLLHEDAYKIRGLLSEGRKRSIYVTRVSRIAYVAYELSILTDLSIGRSIEFDDVQDWKSQLEEKEVMVCAASVLRRVLEEELLSISLINVLIIDSCHLISTNGDLKYIMKLYKQCNIKERPRLLALTYPLFASINKEEKTEDLDKDGREDKSDVEINNLSNSDNIENDHEEKIPTDNKTDEKNLNVASEADNIQDAENNDKKEIAGNVESECKTDNGLFDGNVKNECSMGVYKNVDDFEMYEKLGWKIEELESDLCCDIDLAEDIDGGKRLSGTVAKPKELIIEYGRQIPIENLPELYKDLDHYMRTTIQDALDFINEHRYDPSEIYGEDLYEEFINIPDPTMEPKEIFGQFLYILDELGPYAADKAAFALLARLEKLKIKVPYERHFLLLCMCTSLLVKIRAYAEEVFSKYSTDWEKIEAFCSPKVLRFAEILERFRPESEKMEIEKADRVEKEANSEETVKTDKEGTQEVGAELEIAVSEKEGVVVGVEDVETTESIEAVEIQAKENVEREEIGAKGVVISEKQEADSVLRKEEEKSAEKVERTEAELEEENGDTKIETIDQANIIEQTESEKSENEKKELKGADDITPSKTETINDTASLEESESEKAENSNIIEVVEAEERGDVEISNIEQVHSLVTDIDKQISVTKEEAEGEKSTDLVDEVSSENLEGKKEELEKIALRTKRMLETISDCDFSTLGDRIEDNVNALTGNLKDLETPEWRDSVSEMEVAGKNESQCKDTIDEGLKKILPEQEGDNSATERDSTPIHSKSEDESLKETEEISKGDVDICASEKEGSTVSSSENELKCIGDNDVIQNVDVQKDSERTNRDCSAMCVPKSEPKSEENKGVRRQRTRGRTRANRGQARVQQLQLSPDALCGIMFLREPLMAKILFMLIVDMSRSRPGLNYVCAQYCASGITNGNEIQECQRQNKKQEEVLKKFRMHECNLLLATSVLEEGIDLPRCNLVVRWDLPASYRSHALCRGRARAPRAALTLMAEAPKCSKMLLRHLAIYRELDQIITRKCGCGIQDEPPPEEESHADELTAIIKAYCPLEIKLIETLKQMDSVKLSKKQLEQLMRIVNERRASIPLKSEVLPDNEPLKDKNTPNSNKDKLEPEERVKNDTDNPNKEHCDTIKDTSSVDKTKVQATITDKNASNCIVDKLESEETVKNDTDSITKEDCDTNKDTSSIEKTVLAIDQADNVASSDSLDSMIVESVRDSSSDRLRTDSSVNQCFESLKLKIVNIVDGKVDSKKGDCDSIASVDLSTAIALINRYCGKLPSDTFTRLAPQWWMEQVELPDRHGNMKTAYICTLRLPLNCPVKYNIVGHPMPTRVLARRIVALQACRILHKSGELDNQLMPIGKENFKAAELEASGGGMAAVGVGNAGLGMETGDAGDSARPGTTKRRQYYFKRTAWAFTDCQPVIDVTDADIEDPGSLKAWEESRRELKPGVKRNNLYAIESRLWCALPERYNTRGRRLHAPQHANQAIGILMARQRPDKLQIPAFPVYTRSGEVRVSVELASEADVRLSPRRSRLIRRFMRFVFADVLRVRRRGMKLQSDGAANNNYYVVPTVKTVKEDGTYKVDIDWNFLELIYNHTEEKKNVEVEKPVLFQQDDEEEAKTEKKTEKEEKCKKMDNPLLKPGEIFVFDAEKYNEAVVTPWYRNRDQPQFFLVAEICWNLSPESAFPSATHTTFRDYYGTKYGVSLSQPHQPLLDVDHTSARLNLLTPRYVNRKGVALPVSSERTRRAKRDRLDQKQILVPELCRVHPFAAPLWFATVALPCVLYRINALLIADEIRRSVAVDVGLGIPDIDEATCPGFQWPPLDFGWSLAEVLSADTEKGEKKKGEDDEVEEDKDGQKKREARSLEDDKEENEEHKKEMKEKTINDILQEKEDAENGFEIGTWTNDMASSIPETVEYDEFLEPLPANLTFCTSASGGANWSDPIEKRKVHYGASRTFSVADSDCSYLSSDFDTDDSDANSDGSDDDTDTAGFSSSKNSNAAMGVRIEYKTAHEAEAVDVERARTGPPPPQPCPEDDALDLKSHSDSLRAAQPPELYIEQFKESVKQHETDIIEKGLLLRTERPLSDLLPDATEKNKEQKRSFEKLDLGEIFPYGAQKIELESGQVTLESVERNKRLLLEDIKKRMPKEESKKMNCFSMKDVDIDSPDYVNEKLVNVGFDSKEIYKEKVKIWKEKSEFKPYYQDGKMQNSKTFDFDHQPDLDGHPGPSPSVILQALTMSNANDGINLERLETIGDSFLKFAITAYLYCAHPAVHEGKLSHMRSKQVSNLNLYRLGRGKRLGARMTASKFEPHDNWLPPCHRAPPTLHRRTPEGQDQPPPITDGTIDNSGCFIPYNLITQHSIPDKSIADCVEALIGAYLLECGPRGALLFMSWLGIRVLPRHDVQLPENHPYVIAYKDGIHEAAPVAEKSPSPKREQTVSDSSSLQSESEVEEEEEAMGDSPWEEPHEKGPEPDWGWPGRAVGSLRPYAKGGVWYQSIFGELKAPPSPLLRYIEDPEGELEQMLSGYEALERTLKYRFRDRSLLLQALTHASHQKNRLTDCYQRLEFLGDAILDYLITRHLYEDARRHSPGALTDLRSALVNNTIFATLAARHGFHKYFRHMSPGLNEVLTKYVKIQEENGHSISEEHYLIYEDEMEQAEDVEVPKALGDLFESIAGAIFLDSGMSLGAVWRSYVRLMGAELEAFSAAAPKSPVRELLEAEPDTAKFGKPERLADGRRVRVCVEVFGRGAFKGVGRNYRIAKGTAARCALRHLRDLRPR